MSDIELEKLEQGKKISQALMDHALKNRLTRDDVVAYRFANDFIPQVIAYGESRVAAEVRHRQVENHKLNVENRTLRSRIAELEAALKLNEELRERLMGTGERAVSDMELSLAGIKLSMQVVRGDLTELERSGRLG